MIENNVSTYGALGSGAAPSKWRRHLSGGIPKDYEFEHEYRLCHVTAVGAKDWLRGRCQTNN